MELKKTESMTMVSSCHQLESCVVDGKIGEVWDAVRSFEWAKLFPTTHSALTFTSGNANEVGSMFEVTYTCGSVWLNRITEISEKHRTISYELISATPELEYSSQENTIRLTRVTVSDQTFLAWETEFSNDAGSNVVQDNKYKKRWQRIRNNFAYNN